MAEMTATEVLTTTRAVRRRMDFDRPVPREVILECIDIALQAPTGGNVERWRWLVVDDLEQRRALAQLYRDAALSNFRAARDAAPTGDGKSVYDAAIHLAENLERVPVIVIPCSLGTPPADAWAAAGFFGSILPATWSFQLALRSRGLGSAYTSAILSRHAELAEILGIPDDVTPAAMIPVGHTKGTSFRPARRSPATEVTYFDHWGEFDAS